MNSYHEILEQASQRRETGASIEGQEVYYECRKPPAPRQKFRQENRQVYYIGKLNGTHAECIAIKPLISEALAGEIIGFQCDQKPTEPKLFRFRETHRGQCGILEGNVFCRIISRFQNIPDR